MGEFRIPLNPELEKKVISFDEGEDDGSEIDRYLYSICDKYNGLKCFLDWIENNYITIYPEIEGNEAILYYRDKRSSVIEPLIVDRITITNVDSDYFEIIIWGKNFEKINSFRTKKINFDLVSYPQHGTDYTAKEVV